MWPAEHEATSISPADVDSKRMVIHIKNGKGKKDRIVPLPQSTLHILRLHYKTHRNKHFIFPAPGRGGILESKSAIPVPDSSVQTVHKKALRDARIIKKVPIHNLRHSYATHLLEASSDTLKLLAKDEKYLGADIGMIGILHTWTRAMIYHPHVHYLIPGGGIGNDGKTVRFSDDDFLMHIKPLSIIFKAKFSRQVDR